MPAIELKPNELMTQAVNTAESYLYSAVEAIDKKFGDGFAKQHPELVAAFMRTAANDFHTAIAAQAVHEAAETVADAIDRTHN